MPLSIKNSAKLSSFTVKILLFFGLWQAFVALLQIPFYFLPSPIQVILAIYNNCDLLLENSFCTLLQVLGGLLISAAFGVIIAFTLDWYPKLREFVQPVLVILQATPSFVLMPLFMLWLGYGFLPKMIVICLSAIFPISLCLLNQLKQIPIEWLELAKVMGASPLQTTRVIRWPGALPGLFSGLRLAATYIPLTVLATDWNGASKGLGYLVMLSHGRLQIDLMFACLFLIVCLTLGLNYCLSLLEKRCIFWLPGA